MSESLDLLKYAGKFEKFLEKQNNNQPINHIQQKIVHIAYDSWFHEFAMNCIVQDLREHAGTLGTVMNILVPLRSFEDRLSRDWSKESTGCNFHYFPVALPSQNGNCK